jgi:xanthine dehydrogenase/oxidase
LSCDFDSGCTDGAGGGGDLGMATQWADNCYRSDDFAAGGSISLTPKPGNTSCRAPGVIQSVLLHEIAMEHAAEACGMSAEDLREVNFYQVGDKAPFGVVIGEGGFNWTVPQMWKQAKEQWQVDERREACVAFNRANTWRKRGLSMLPIKYGIGYQSADYHEAASVRIFGGDGSVSVTHGGCELGQGIHTKVAQAVAYALGCPLDAIQVEDTSSLASANSKSTGGSATSELCVKTVLNACDTLNASLLPYRPQDPGKDKGWAATVVAAAKHNAPLSAVGWFGGDGTGGSHGSGTKWEYATQGVGCVEVEVDVLSGEVQLTKAQLLMDQGTPLNPLIDLGQVEGGFVMALGLVLTEEVLWGQQGEQLNLGSWQYKVPAVHDIPISLDVSFLPHTPNPKSNATLRSKASGEPPMALASAAFLAVRHAIKAAREDAGSTSAFQLDAPLTPQAIQQACLVSADRFVLG